MYRKHSHIVVCTHATYSYHASSHLHLVQSQAIFFFFSKSSAINSQKLSDSFLSSSGSFSYWEFFFSLFSMYFKMPAVCMLMIPREINSGGVSSLTLFVLQQSDIWNIFVCLREGLMSPRLALNSLSSQGWY